MVPGRPGGRGLVVAGLVAAGVVLVTGALAIGKLTAPPEAPSSQETVQAGVGDVIRWQTDVVALAASSFSIDAAGMRFAGSPTATVHSDPGSLTYWTLEVEWREQGRIQRVNLYFAADQASWWINEARVYDGGVGPSEHWVTFPGGPWARTPLGAEFSGDLDLAAVASTGPVRLHLGGVRIAVRPRDPVTRPIGGGITLPTNGDPFQAGGPLHCSGILQLPPKVAEARLLTLGYRLSWRWEYSTSDGAGTGYSEVSATAPDRGWISSTAVGSGGELVVFVEDPARPMMPAATPPADCPPAAP
jgi:hypothetical protein